MTHRPRTAPTTLLWPLLVACAPPEGQPRPYSGPGDGSADTADPLPAGTLGILHEEGLPTSLDTWPTVNYRGVDIAWSEQLGLFLTVYGNAPIGGAFLDVDGVQVGSGFRLTEAEYDGSNWTQNPRVVADGDGFLVSWHAERGEGVVVQARHVGGGPVFDGPEIDLSAPGAMQESAAALAWSPDSGEHVIVWAQEGLHLRRLDASGQALADAVDLTEAGVWVEQPAAVHAPSCGCFFVTTMQEREDGAHVLLIRVEDATGATLGDALDLSGAVDFAKVTDITLDQARDTLIASWYQIRDGVAGFAAQRFSSQAEPLGEASTIFAPYGSYDGYDLAWSPVTGTSLGVFHGFTASTAVAELSATQEEGPALILDPAGAAGGVFLPRAVAHPTEPSWLVLGSPDYAGVVLQRVARD